MWTLHPVSTSVANIVARPHPYIQRFSLCLLFHLCRGLLNKILAQHRSPRQLSPLNTRRSARPLLLLVHHLAFTNRVGMQVQFTRGSVTRYCVMSFGGQQIMFDDATQRDQRRSATSVDNIRKVVCKEHPTDGELTCTVTVRPCCLWWRSCANQQKCAKW